MRFQDRLRGVAIAMLILVACFPIAVVLTIVLSPAWSWLELRFGIEAYGHSGPAEWCYLVTYGLLVSGCSLVWTKINRMKAANEGG